MANPKRPTIGLALSGGGAKGIAHVGTLQMIDSLEIPIDYIVGTSMGGIVGALYSIGYSGDDLEYLVKYIDWVELFTDKPVRDNVPFLRKKYDGRHQIVLGLEGFTPVIPEALIEGQNVMLLFSRLTMGYQSVDNFDQLPIPYQCVATDLVKGKEVIINSGSLAKAMRTTMSIPTVFKPVSWGDSLLVDGGLVNNLPTDVLKDMGVDIIIAVDVGAPLLERKDIKSLVDVFQQTYNLLGLERIEQNIKLADILVSPDIKSFSPADFDPKQVDLLLEQGRIAAAKKLQEFRTLKNRLHIVETQKKNRSRTASVDPIRRIYGLQITGNENLSFSFIYNQIGLSPGDLFNENELENRITQLYALGYFKMIDYDHYTG